MLRKKTLGVLTVLVVIVVLLASVRVYYVRTEPSGDLFWNADNAYIFIGLNDQGRSFNYLGFAVEELREIFPFGASAPSNKHSSVLVLHVTPNLIQTYSTDNFWPTGITPLEGFLYTGDMLPGGALMKWSDTHFELATSKERTKLQLALQGSRIPPTPSYNNIEGWSKRPVVGEIVSESPTVSVEKDAKVTIELGGKQVTFVMNSGFITHKAYIDLIRPGQPPERIWSLDEDGHRVSRAEYERTFRTR